MKRYIHECTYCGKKCYKPLNFPSPRIIGSCLWDGNKKAIWVYPLWDKEIEINTAMEMTEKMLNVTTD